jgi:prolyl oligopeptidase
MLRYQRFGDGKLWVTGYGSSESQQQFKFLVKYSPYQNVKPGTKYPAVLFFTGSNDSRVGPVHARKMAALMQADSAGGRPILLEEGSSGQHSSGLSVDRQTQDAADLLTFLWNETGQTAAAK